MAQLNDTESVAPGEVQSPAAASFAPGTLIDSRYEIGRHLGRGGSCDVYSAHDKRLSKEVALKVLRTDRVSEQALARLRREVAVAQKILSPRVVRIHDLAVSGEMAFIAMELVDGETLAARLARTEVPVAGIVRIAREILEGLVAIHAEGIVHRDIKPSNILIDRDDRAKIGDLGLARQFDSEEQKLTRTEALVGTLPYLSPEQALGMTPDSRSDLYSLGATLYEALTGQLPFERRSKVGTLVSHIIEKAPPVRALRPDVPRWLDRFIQRLLEKEPGNRFQSAVHALESLERRRVPLRWRTIGSPLAVLAALIAAGAGIWWSLRPGALASFVPTKSGIRAVDARGRTLWAIDGANAERAWILNRGTGRETVAVIPGTALRLSRAERTRLLLLDPRTGRELSHSILPGADASFSGFDDRFGVEADVIDSNGDGADEIVFEFKHTYWPWYAVHYDSATGAGRLVYLSTGHQTASAVADIDGDGRNEMLFAGRDNRMGWYASLAAVPLRAATPMTAAQRVEFGAPCSPMVERASLCIEGHGGWHTLLPRRSVRSIEVDARSKTIHVIDATGERMDVRFDGRRVGVSTDLAVALPNRALTHKLLRSAQTLEEAGRYRAALEEVEAARRSAAESGDPLLLEWTDRVRVKLMIRSGEVEAAEALSRVLMASSDSAPDIAFDLGLALSLHGEYDRAATAFEEGLVNDRNPTDGRLKYEFIEGAAFALVSAGRVDEALDLVWRTRGTGGVTETAYDRELYRAGILWLAGRGFDPPVIDPNADGATDLRRYWALEFAWRRERDATSLLPQVRQAIARNGTLRGLLQSLEAELLAAVGRQSEASAVAREAAEWTERERERDMIVRVHEKIVRMRLATITSAVEKTSASSRIPVKQ